MEEDSLMVIGNKSRGTSILVEGSTVEVETGTAYRQNGQTSNQPEEVYIVVNNSTNMQNKVVKEINCFYQNH